ncbi:Hypothetical protein PHPALM_17202 [Phytophthora palmivora]|uniref:BHLH domain-containing protein n=1 Tax=Phytophthora palmivora TaxID=4796 RepID=A0A2P4XMU7_9STRA|nr:Hypothetical protein PHPALM_17202 [Phytophthora palmivora]
MYRRFPGANLPSSNNLVGQQVDDQRNSLLHKNENDCWNRFSLSFMDEQQEQQRCEKGAESKTLESSQDYKDGISTEHVTSPPLSSFSMLTKDGDGFRLNFGSLPKESVYQHQANAPDNEHVTEINTRAMQDAMELVSFKLGQQDESSVLEMSRNTGDTTGDTLVNQSEVATTLPSLHCPNVSSSDDDDMLPIGGSSMTNSEHFENDRGFRKKSREKMRRHEVNIKVNVMNEYMVGKLIYLTIGLPRQFEMLVNVLGLAGRVRKKNILHEAASTIKGLRRECNQLRYERDRLQQQLGSLATYLQNPEQRPPHLMT